MILGIQQIAVTVKGQIEDFKPNIPLIQALRAPGMRNRHWEEVCSIARSEIPSCSRCENFSFRNWSKCLYDRRRN